MKKIIKTNGGHMFASIGIGDFLRCNECGLEIPRTDIRLFLKRANEDVKGQYKKAEALVDALTVLSKNNFREGEPDEVKDMKTELGVILLFEGAITEFYESQEIRDFILNGAPRRKKSYVGKLRR